MSSLAPPDRRAKSSSQSTGSLLSHPVSSSSGCDSISESIASLTSGSHSHAEMALLKREVQKLTTIETCMMRLMNSVESLAAKMESFEHRIRSLETMQLDASKSSQTLYVDGSSVTAIPSSQNSSSFFQPNNAFQGLSSGYNHYDSDGSFEIDDTWSEDEDEEEHSDNASAVEQFAVTRAAVPRVLTPPLVDRRKTRAAPTDQNANRGYTSNVSLHSQQQEQHQQQHQVASEYYAPAHFTVDPKVELAELHQLFPSRYDLFAAIFVGIFDQIQQLAEQTEHSTIMFNNSAGDVYQRIQRLCSCLRYEGTKDEIKLPLRNAPAMVTVMRQFKRESKTEIVTVTASSLLSLSSARSLRPVYRALVALWRRMQLFPELFPAPYNDILKYCSKDIIKSVRYDPKLDPSMNPQYPAIYDIDLSKLRSRFPTQREALAMKINFSEINTYILRRQGGQDFNEAIEGITKETKDEKKAKLKAVEAAATNKKKTPVKPLTMKDLAKLRKSALQL